MLLQHFNSIGQGLRAKEFELREAHIVMTPATNDTPAQTARGPDGRGRPSLHGLSVRTLLLCNSSFTVSISMANIILTLPGANLSDGAAGLCL